MSVDFIDIKFTLKNNTRCQTSLHLLQPLTTPHTFHKTANLRLRNRTLLVILQLLVGSHPQNQPGTLVPSFTKKLAIFRISGLFRFESCSSLLGLHFGNQWIFPRQEKLLVLSSLRSFISVACVRIKACPVARGLARDCWAIIEWFVVSLIRSSSLLILFWLFALLLFLLSFLTSFFQPAFLLLIVSSPMIYMMMPIYLPILPVDLAWLL